MTNSIMRITPSVGQLTIEANQGIYKEGQVIDAEIIEKVPSGTKILLNEDTIQVSGQVEIVEAVGEKASFLVEKVDKETITLKYIKPESLKGNQPSIVLPKMQSVKMDQNFEMKIKEQMSQVDVTKEQQLEKMATDLKGKITAIVETATDEDVKAIIKDNYNVEKITVEMFKALVDQNKIALRMDDQGSLLKAVAEKVATFEGAFQEKFGGVDTLKTIVANMKEANLPIQLKQIEKVQLAVDQYNALDDLSDEQILAVLKNQKPFTLEEVAKVISSPVQEVIIPDDVMKLSPQVQKILDANGIDPSLKNMMIANKAIAMNIPLDETALEKLRVLTSEVGIDFKQGEEIFVSAEVEEVIKRAVANIANKLPANRINLPLEIRLKEVSAADKGALLVNQLDSIKDDSIVQVIEEKQVVNLKNILNANASQIISQEPLEISESTKQLEPRWTNMSMVISRVVQNTNNFRFDQSVEMTLETLNVNAKTIVDEAGDLQFIKAKICIEELRLKMTYESATRLYDKGIEVDMEPLESVVEHLKALEKEQYSKALEVHQVPANEGNLREMEATMTAVSKLSMVATYTKLAVVAREIPFTLEAITVDAQISNNEALFVSALSRYETMETEIRPDLGDSIEKTFSQIGSILEELGLEKNIENTRVAKALAKSESPITVQNIEGIKLLDEKISLLTDALKPTMVAAMIKEQINPISMDIDTLTDLVRGYGDAFLNTETEKLAEAILQVKKSDSLSPDQKESLIGIYRMLRTISNSKGTAAAFLVKKDLPLNIKNLFEAAKYMKTNKGRHTKIEANISDDFGLLERLEFKGEQISQQIERALTSENMSQTKHHVELLEDLVDQQVPLVHDNITQADHHHIQLERFFQNFSHESMSALAKEGHLEDFEKPFSEVTALLKESGQPLEGSDHVKEIVDRLSDMVKMDIQTLKTFEKYGMKANTSQMFTHFMLKENAFEMSAALNKLFANMDQEGLNSMPLRRSMEQLIQGTLGDDYEETLEEVKVQLGKVREDSLNQQGSQGQDSQRQMNQSTQIIEYQQQLMKQEDYYQIPVWMDNQWVQLNLYYQNHSNNVDAKAEDEMDVYLFFETKAMGKVQSHMHLKEKKMQFSIYSEKTEDRSRLQGYQAQFMEILNQDGFEVEHISYDYFEGKSPINEGLEKQATEQLRYVDSKFIASV